MVKRNPLEELKDVPAGTVITYTELCNLCGAGLTMGDNVSLSRTLNLVKRSDRSVPWLHGLNHEKRVRVVPWIFFKGIFKARQYLFRSDVISIEGEHITDSWDAPRLEVCLL